ncbi:DUF3084 domain-containing protein [uncultured Megasphaera sp.]|uniref:DUF3084 domain-containing protein n=1 Tax=uncultured Megasphaera sp. TaxID=165188 RepID=UPI0025978855|nr:DUF3084 domain-containing protein [uncultured Megasphaera sp.]
MEYGWIMLFVLAIMGGIIAYLGDKIGSRVGKRKIKLFGLRPKYTSVLVTILTGISIAAVTLGVMSILSENVRIALFGMQQLRMQNEALETQRNQLLKQAGDLGKELDEKNRLIASNEELLQLQQEQLDGKNEEIRLTQLDLQQAQAARDDKARQLSVIQVAMDKALQDKDKAVADRDAAQHDLAVLEETKERMVSTIEVLDKRIRILNETMTNIREGTVMFRVGEVLSSVVLSSGQDGKTTREELSRAMQQTNAMICRYLGITDENAVMVYIAPDEFNAAISALQQGEAGGKKLIRLIAAGNIMVGEPALVHIDMHDNNLIYHKGDVVYETELNESETAHNPELQVMRFLHDVNLQAKAKGVLPDPLSGNVGALSATEMFDTISRIKGLSGEHIVLRAVTLNDTYTAGPLGIDIIVEPIQ